MPLIDKNELLKKIHENPASNHAMRCVQLLDAITCAPPVDAVLVVRCKDCKHWGALPEQCETENVKCCSNLFRMFYKDSYCVHGERKSEEDGEAE